jgi:hypothetical protein
LRILSAGGLFPGIGPEFEFYSVLPYCVDSVIYP